MTTKRETILAYVKTLLDGLPSGGTPKVFRSRPEALRSEELPAWLLDWTADGADYNTMDFINRTLNIRITLLVNSLTADAVADPLYAAMYEVMMANRSLGGRCQDLTPVGDTVQYTEGDKPIMALSCQFLCTYRHTAADAEV